MKIEDRNSYIVGGGLHAVGETREILPEQIVEWVCSLEGSELAPLPTSPYPAIPGLQLQDFLLQSGLMIDQFFLNSDIVSVTAATVGIGSNRWVSIPADKASEENARQKMEKHRFDVLPIEPGDGPTSSYYVTEEWGDFDAIHRQTIGYEDTLPFRRSIRSVIEELSETERKFFFLTQDQQVVGLLTVSNLNCRSVRVYLFGLMTEMETGLARVVEKSLDGNKLGEEDVVDQMKDKKRKQYQEDEEEGLDENITEYLYLSDLVNIIGKHHLYEPLGYKSRSKFEDGFGSVIGFRQSIAHPVRSLEGTYGSPSSMWKNIETCERALFRLHNNLSSAEV